MSLYYDAALILSAEDQRGSLKSRVYHKNAGIKSTPAHVYALISETAKYDSFLKEVIENAGILKLESKLTPLLALLLLHDRFFAKGGIAAAASHPLRLTIEKHKARLQAEFTRARLRRGAATIEALKSQLLGEKGPTNRASPRWARVNALRATLPDLLNAAFVGYVRVDKVADLLIASKNQKIVYIDENIPNLVAFQADEDVTRSVAYLNGNLILQDKASCFPAHLLLGNGEVADIGDVLDGCAAPGNKTTHAAAILKERGSIRLTYACERDAIRSETLRKMVTKAGAINSGAGNVTVLSKQDFLAIDPYDSRFASVTHILLDPSCSGSGILGREDVPRLALPDDPRKHKRNKSVDNKSDDTIQPNSSKKRKHNVEPKRDTIIEDDEDLPEDDPTSEAQHISVDQQRLEKLATLQSLIVEHAFTFPAARRITYSTCSIHVEENEAVVERVLASKAGRRGNWRVLPRDEQVEGLRKWSHRGVARTGQDKRGIPRKEHSLDEITREACIRCSPDDGEGTMGFFVCGFVRDEQTLDEQDRSAPNQLEISNEDETMEKEGSDWEGFSDG